MHVFSVYFLFLLFLKFIESEAIQFNIVGHSVLYTGIICTDLQALF